MSSGVASRPRDAPIPTTKSEITPVPRLRRNDRRPSPVQRGVVEIRRPPLGEPPQQVPPRPAGQAGDEQREDPPHARCVRATAVLQASGVVAEGQVLHVEEHGHQAGTEEPGGDTGDDHGQPEGRRQPGIAVTGGVGLLDGAASLWQALLDQWPRVPRTLADPGLPPVARSSEPALHGGAPRGAAWTGQGTLAPAGRPDIVVAVSLWSTLAVYAARAAHHWLTSPSAARLACRRGPASGLTCQPAQGGGWVLLKHCPQREPALACIRWPTLALSWPRQRGRWRVTMIPLRTGVRSAPTRSPRLPALLSGRRVAARRASGNSGGTGCALISAPTTLRRRAGRRRLLAAPRGRARRRGRSAATAAGASTTTPPGPWGRPAAVTWGAGECHGPPPGPGWRKG